MKKEYIKGYLLDEEDVGCDKYPICFTCPFERCKGEADKKQRAIHRKYYQRHKDEIKEKQRQWREKQRLAKLLDKKREQAEKENKC